MQTTDSRIRGNGAGTSADAAAYRTRHDRGGLFQRGLLFYALIGVFFGVLLVKSEVVSWFRIQEMFRFHSFHMYGIIGSAIVVAAAAVAIIKRRGLRTLGGHAVVVEPKAWTGVGTRYWAGGITFGLGWALVGACPGPIFALIGGGVTVFVVALAAAVAGTWTYGAIRDRLPH